MTAPTADEKRRHAYHEAGHAVAAVALGGTLDLVTVEDEPHRGSLSGGRCRAELPQNPALLRNRMIFSHAGAVAVGLACAGDRWREGIDEDERLIAAAVRAAGLSDAEAGQLYRETGVAAVRLVRAHWPAVDALARTLLRRHTLSGEAAAAVIARASRRTA